MPTPFFSPACERNKVPICEQLKAWVPPSSLVLEVGSGTGQHAIHFAQAMPMLRWQPSETPEQINHLKRAIERHDLSNLLTPLSLDVVTHPWQSRPCDVIFTANTLHIIPWQSVQHFLSHLAEALNIGGLFIAYGPFRRKGCFHGSSNKLFDQQLRCANPAQGIRDAESVDLILSEHGLLSLANIPMPANNELLIWSRQQ